MRFDGAELRMSGRAVTNPVISSSNSERVTFRAVSTERRYDDAVGEWVDGDEFATTVVCWGKLGVQVLQMVRKGDPVVLDGRMVSRRFERNGATEYMQECKADHVGFDIGRSNNRVMRNPRHASENPESESATTAGAAADVAAADPTGEKDPFALARTAAEEPELAGAPF
ncbi:single-strand DNA-binding protein [Nakamurella panacisegetis]|uniref:Single-stranded DNA-binding protein n=1 Tax=Nakamurella panacisegetis TaxID=1090615 RepID=A0A1H0T6D2_9ACTN|nr:single-stranded DNA-binding protein [Nakamurella panacisegetis]SDP49415.1 single-strand DNA-binding protein [Nakamurella panacisegetis]